MTHKQTVWLAIGAALVAILITVGCGRRPSALLPEPRPDATVAQETEAAGLPTDAQSVVLPPTIPATVTPSRTFTVTPRPTDTATPRPTTTPTPTPTPLPGTGLVAFESYRDGNGEIYLLDTVTGALTNLTRHEAEDRAPAWRPDGGAIAFESHRDGNWELYVVAAPGGTPRRLTNHPAGDYGPAWRPDGGEIAFTSWRDGNKEVYLVPAGGGDAVNVTQHPADDEDPAWHPDGAMLAFTSWRDEDPATGSRNADVYAVQTSGRAGASAAETQRLTESAWPDVDPAWDAAGRLVWAAYEPGPAFEAYDPTRPGDYHVFRRDVGAQTGPERLTDADWDDRRPFPAPGQVAGLAGLAERLPALPATPTAMPTLAPGMLAQVVPVPEVLVDFTGEPVLVNERVAPSLVAWQRDVLAASGWDWLHGTKGTWRPIDAVGNAQYHKYDYAYLSWHKTGRAIDLGLELQVDGRDQLVKVREDLGGSIYWRLYLRTARQDGSQGEPLKEQPWLFWWQIVEAAEPEAYAAGGKRLPIPEGYYIDVTAIAKRHGWHRIATYAIDDYDWHVHSNGTEYWHYERTDGLSWWEAMLEVYPAETLETYFAWDVGLGRRQTEEMMRTKGISGE